MATEGKGRRRAQTLLGLAIFLVLTILGGLLWYNHSANKLFPEIIEKLPENVDLGLDNVHYSQNEDGHKIWVLDAVRAAYQRKNDELTLTEVSLTLFNAGSFGELRLNAARGQLHRQQKLIDLQGEVRIVAATGERLRTDHLQYDMQRQLVTTDAPIQTYGRLLELTGIGMTLDLKRGRLRVLKNVHALLEKRMSEGEAQ